MTTRSTPPPPTLIPAGGWRLRAACRNHPTLPPSTWDDALVTGDDERQENKSTRATRVAAAKAVCAGCPVRLPCLADVDLRWDEGVRGGVDLRELDAARRKASA